MQIVIYLLGLSMLVLGADKPNIVLILTDDQDVELGGMTPMKHVQNLIANKGATFNNAFASTPLCCPSRSSILTGLYLHRHHTVNNSISGGCSSRTWQRNFEPTTYGAELHRHGYSTFYAGKYLNYYGYEAVGGPQHVPTGWDWWVGLVGNSRYYDYTLSINGTARKFTNQYLTSVIQNYSIDFLESMRNTDKSFLMVLAPPAPHAPFTPEPKYMGKYKGIKVPRTPNFNTHKLKNRHWLLNMKPTPLPARTVALLDYYQSRRWETLLSVDDLVLATINKLQDIGQLNNTFIIYTSDHGYHLGQFALTLDKRQPYETDIRVPLFVRGPGIKRKSILDTPVVNIDIAPTILDMAGLAVAKHMDGRSFLNDTRHSPTSPPRAFFTVEYIGEGDSRLVSSECPLVNDNNISECYVTTACKCQDSRNNTFVCLRQLDSKENFLYCLFYKEIGGHEEFYDLNIDPYQLENKIMDLSFADRSMLQLKALERN